jgi:hypothetical protein
MTRIVIAQGLTRKIMYRIGLAGLAMPWRTIYLLEEFKGKADLIAHEQVHIAQMERDGRVKFSILYLWWLARYGYWSNPYEIEAYALAPVEWPDAE